MSASVEEVKKFLQDKSAAEDTETLKVTRLGNTNGDDAYRIIFLRAQAEEPKEPAKKNATPSPSKKKD